MKRILLTGFYLRLVLVCMVKLMLLVPLKLDITKYLRL